MEEWIVQGMYANVRSLVGVGEGYSEEFEVKVGVHQISVLSPFSSSLCLKPYHESSTLGSPGRTSMPMTLLSSLNCLKNVRRLLTWKEAMEKKGLGVNAGKTKIMIYGTGLDHWSGQQQHLLQWLQALGAQEMQWLKRVTKDPDYRCALCQGTAHPLDGRPQREVQVGPDKLEVVASFCYLGDTLSAAGGCEFSTTTHVKTAWKKFKELLPVLPSRHLSFKTRVQLLCEERNAPCQ